MRSSVFFVLTHICFVLIIWMRASGASSGPKFRTDRKAVGTECHGCGKMFSHLFAYDHHRRSSASRNRASALIQNRFGVSAMTHANMTTAAVQRRQAQRTGGDGIFCIFCIFYIFCIYIAYRKILKQGLPAAGTPIQISEDYIFFNFLHIFDFLTSKWGGSRQSSQRPQVVHVARDSDNR